MALKARLVKNLEGAKQHDQCDVVEHNGEYWLVPQWIESDRPRSKRPARMVSLKTIPHEKTRGQHEFRIRDPPPSRALVMGLTADGAQSFSSPPPSTRFGGCFFLMRRRSARENQDR